MGRGAMVLAAVGLAMVLASIWALSVGEAPPARHLWLPELFRDSHKITEVVIDDPQGTRVLNAKRNESGWHDVETNKAIDAQPLGALVIALARAEVVAAETSLRANYAKYHQFEPGNGEPTAWRIELASSGGYRKVLWIGDDGGPELYVRVEPDATVFRIGSRLPLPPLQAPAWIRNDEITP